jgi:predicted nucleic acid-binding protein
MRDEQEHVVIDAAALLDLLVATDIGLLLHLRLERCLLHAPGNIEAEVLAGLDRLEAADVLARHQALRRLEALSAAPIERHPLAALLEPAWRRRRRGLRLSSVLCIELARTLGIALITTEPQVADAAGSIAELIALPARGLTT